MKEACTKPESKKVDHEFSWTLAETGPGLFGTGFLVLGCYEVWGSKGIGIGTGVSLLVLFAVKVIDRRLRELKE